VDADRLPTRQVLAFRGIFDDIFYAHLERFHLEALGG
jgi:hypothetical protein